jgi:hypothetical protein
MRHHVHVTTIPSSEPRPHEHVETPEQDLARTAGREGSRRDKKPTEEGHDGDNLYPSKEAAGRDSAAGASRHEVRDRGEGRRRDAGPATQCHAHAGYSPPRDHRPWRSTPFASAGPPARERKQGPLLPGRPPRSRARRGCQRLGPSSADECQARAAERQPLRARQPGRHHGGSGRKRVIVEGSKTSGLPQLGSRRPGLGSRRVTP